MPPRLNGRGWGIPRGLTGEPWRLRASSRSVTLPSQKRHRSFSAASISCRARAGERGPGGSLQSRGPPRSPRADSVRGTMLPRASELSRFPVQGRGSEWDGCDAVRCGGLFQRGRLAALLCSAFATRISVRGEAASGDHRHVECDLTGVGPLFQPFLVALSWPSDLKPTAGRWSGRARTEAS